MQKFCLATLAWSLLSCWAATLAAQEQSFVENGVVYHNTVRRVRVPVVDTQFEERTQTVYREQLQTDIYESQRNVFVPVTEYQWQPRWRGRLNPFRQPSLSYHLVPRTSWQVHQQTVQTPVTKRQWIPEERTVRVPVTKLRLDERKELVRRPTNYGLSRSQVRSATVLQPAVIPVGGVVRMESDPPRRGSLSPNPKVLR